MLEGRQDIVLFIYEIVTSKILSVHQYRCIWKQHQQKKCKLFYPQNMIIQMKRNIFVTQGYLAIL